VEFTIPAEPADERWRVRIDTRLPTAPDERTVAAGTAIGIEARSIVVLSNG
jgi:hypothetical protein